MPTISQNLAVVRDRINQACAAVDRDPAGVRLMPVSKTHPMSALREAYAAGYSLLAENKVQELQAKAAELEPGEGIEFSFIGHLQTNKAKVVAELASELQTLDSVKLARELDKRLTAIDKTLPVLLQVNSSREPQKSGLAPEEVLEFTRELETFTHLDVRGLMTVAVKGDEAAVTACFEDMLRLQEQLRANSPLPSGWDELSMGMSGDLDLAIKHGSTCVRVGTAIFGARDYGQA